MTKIWDLGRGREIKKKDQDDLIERQCWTPNTELEKEGGGEDWEEGVKKFDQRNS